MERPLHREDTLLPSSSSSVSHGPSREASVDNNPTSADDCKCENDAISKMGERNIDLTLVNWDTEACGRDGRDNMDFSPSGPSAEASEAFGDTSKTSEGARTEDASTDSSILEVMMLNENMTMSGALENAARMVDVSGDGTTAGFENNFAAECYRSINKATPLLGPEHNGNVGYRPNDDIIVHHKANSSRPGDGQTGGNPSIDCDYNQSPNNLNTDDGTRRRMNLRSIVIFWIMVYRAVISLGLRRDKNGLSSQRTNSQDQTQAIAKSPHASADTGPTDIQQDSNVSVVPTRGPSGNKMVNGSYRGRWSAARRSWSGGEGLWNAVTWAMTLLLVAPTPAQAPPVSPAWQSFSFCTGGASLTHQLLVIHDLRLLAPRCTFRVPSLPFYHNCSHWGIQIFAKNETCVEMWTKEPSTEDYTMGYGNGRKGDSLPATRGERLDEKSVKDKIAEYTKSLKSSAPPPPSASAPVWTAVGALFGGLLPVLASLF